MRFFARDRRRSRAGNAMVEFALASTILFPMFLATFQFGYSFYVYNTISTQVRNGARYASIRKFRCSDAAGITTYKNAVKNMVRYGNPAGTGTVLEPGLTADQVSVKIKDRHGSDADATHTPSYVEVATSGYSVNAIVTTINFNGKPYVRFPYVGVYAPAETE
jgi:Flp pilus assembly protein TadG